MDDKTSKRVQRLRYIQDKQDVRMGRRVGALGRRVGWGRGRPEHWDVPGRGVDGSWRRAWRTGEWREGGGRRWG